MWLQLEEDGSRSRQTREAAFVPIQKGSNIIKWSGGRGLVTPPVGGRQKQPSGISDSHFSLSLYCCVALNRPGK